MMILCINKGKNFSAPSATPPRLRGYIHTHTTDRTRIKSVKTRRKSLVCKGLFLQMASGSLENLGTRNKYMSPCFLKEISVKTRRKSLAYNGLYLQTRECFTWAAGSVKMPPRNMME